MGGPASGGWRRDPQGPARRRACCSVNSSSLQPATGGRSDLRASPASSLGWDGDPPSAVCLTPFSLRAVCSTAALRLVWLVLVCPRGSGALSPGPFSVKEDHRWLPWAGRLQGPRAQGLASLRQQREGMEGMLTAYLLCAPAQPSLPTILHSRYYYYFYFQQEKAKAEREEWTCPRLWWS